MKMALRLARKGLGRTSPNPMVGAVVVRKGRVVGQGFHQKAGGPHAEPMAIAQAGKEAKGATLYVNLEPCNHFGRTPPCTQAIIESGIKKVVFGLADPNPVVKGGGADRLQSQGIKVVRGVLEEDCRRLNEVYIKWITTGLPFVILKAAVSLDGRIATRTGDSKWISNERSRLRVHHLRNRVDGVVVGIRTVITDDPLLTVRLPRGKIKDPLRIVLDPQLRISLKARILEGPAKTLIVSGTKVRDQKRQKLEKKGVEILSLPARGGQISIKELLTDLGRRGITSLLVEGGAEVYGSFLKERLVDKLIIFIAPCLIGGRKAVGMIGGAGITRMTEAIRLKEMSVKPWSGDILVEAYPET
ncbi:MAG: bifunctional diaminohydroxyphosphoribosylaminopyrimidine deaminase/5-amino-6-(5-phosphoribosylamino)uracil reductase RibD [Deltaproteobacteria bacterium]|nr:bifunctional diaminohydroxyphosphoribosylaminopyrimidine deaminase/5-amino-6-(5-phosphoribosylamino)uracil reductase RibD [Deltaproteobacteria bacterium]